MPVFFAALVFFGILTLWVPAYWPTTLFQVGVFALAGVSVLRARLSMPPFSWPLVPLTFAVLWGLAQWLTGHTAYGFETRMAILKWTGFLSVYAIGITLFRDAATGRWFRLLMLWFAFLVAVLATLQTFTSAGKVFWIFPTEYTDYVMGPFVSRNDFAAFIEAVLPFALYRAMQGERDSLQYSGIAATLYASVIASASRAGVVLATAEIALVPLLMWSRSRVSGRAAGLVILRLGILVAILAVVAGPGAVWLRLRAPDPLAVRRELTISTWHMAVSHPWIGTGLGTWSTVYPAYAIVDVGAVVHQAHDDWLQWVAEGGFPFGIMISTLFFWSVRPAFRSVWGIGVVAVFLHAIVDYPFARPALGCWPILIVAMLASASRDRDAKT
jgi:hypothetical protein